MLEPIRLFGLLTLAGIDPASVRVDGNDITLSQTNADKLALIVALLPARVQAEIDDHVWIISPCDAPREEEEPSDE